MLTLEKVLWDCVPVMFLHGKRTKINLMHKKKDVQIHIFFLCNKKK